MTDLIFGMIIGTGIGVFLSIFVVSIAMPKKVIHEQDKADWWKNGNGYEYTED